MIRILHFLLLAAALTSASAATIIYNSTPNPGANASILLPGGSGDAAAFTWTQTASYANISISAFLASNTTPGSVVAYLTNSLGPGTTVANQLAATTVAVPNIHTNYQMIGLFSGLNLGPGTYNLVLTPNSGDAIRWFFTGGTSSTVTKDAGVTSPGATSALGTQGGYAPARNFSTAGDALLTLNIATVDSTPGNIPEPATGVLMTGALGALGLIEWRRRRQR